MISQPSSLQEKLNAMEEMAVRGQAPPQVYDLLKKEAIADTSQYTGQALDDANFVRQAALWALGMLNKSQNAGVKTDELPGLGLIEQILNNKKENSEVQTAAIQALQVIDRPKDKRIQKILKNALKSKNPDVKRFAKEALAGKTIPLPTQQAAG
jgi:HEAT repeat protein